MMQECDRVKQKILDTLKTIFVQEGALGVPSNKLCHTLLTEFEYGIDDIEVTKLIMMSIQELEEEGLIIGKYNSRKKVKEYSLTALDLNNTIVQKTVVKFIVNSIEFSTKEEAEEEIIYQTTGLKEFIEYLKSNKRRTECIKRSVIEWELWKKNKIG